MASFRTVTQRVLKKVVAAGGADGGAGAGGGDGGKKTGGKGKRKDADVNEGDGDGDEAARPKKKAGRAKKAKGEVGGEGELNFFATWESMALTSFAAVEGDVGVKTEADGSEGDETA